MKIARDISGAQLAKLLNPLGYVITRQTGSHIRLTTLKNGQHHITIPNHNPITIGTLSSILSEIASHFNETKDWVIKMVF